VSAYVVVDHFLIGLLAVYWVVLYRTLQTLQPPCCDVNRFHLRLSFANNVQFLMDYTEGSLLQILMIALIIGSKSTSPPQEASQCSPFPPEIKESPVPFFIKPITRGIAGKVESSFIDPELQKHCAFLEDYLSKSSGEFFAGDVITGADIMLHFALEGATRRVPLSETSFPKLYAYVRRLQKRDGYARAAKRVSEANGEEYVPYSDLK
jgi:hypothetical protein